MTEEEWRTGEFPALMMQFLGAQMSNRKYRLLACGWLREEELADERSRRAVEVAERFADGHATEEERVSAHAAADQAMEHCCATGDQRAIRRAGSAKHAVGEIDTAAFAPKWTFMIEIMERRGQGQPPDEPHCRRIREIFGNPFRPVAFLPEWRTDTVLSLARQMYELRDFSAMPILADALQDAGCDNDDVLNHCRGPGPHVRGCWVVDLVLGKE